MGLRTPWLLLAFAPLVGCKTPHACDANNIVQKVEQRTGITTPPRPCVVKDQIVMPPGLDTGRTISEEEAVLLALWNNPLFLETLVDLKLAQADLITAGLLPNPEVIYFFEVPHKPFKYAAEFPIEALWLRPIRLKIAERESARACERLAQAALDLIRDTRQAYTDLALAKERVKVAEDAARLRGRIADLADARYKAGDVSAQEAATARIDALTAKQDLLRIGYEVPLAEARLKALLGMADRNEHLEIESIPLVSPLEAGVDRLVKEAMDTRPDALAAGEAVAAAVERERFAKKGWVRFLGIADASSGRKTGHEFGPAVRITLPIFNWNQGGIARAQAEKEQLERRWTTVRNQVALDVRLADTRYEQARADLGSLREKILPEVQTAIQRSEKSYKEGNAGYVIVLESTRQLIDTNFRDAQLRADLRRAAADLERSVGRKLEAVTKVSQP